MDYIFSKRNPEIGDKGFIIEDRFISIQPGKSKIPQQGLIFYDSLKTNVNVCETGQVRSGSATSYDQVIQNIPCTYFNGSKQWIYYQNFVLQHDKSYSFSIWVNKVGHVRSDCENGFCCLGSNEKRIGIVDSTQQKIIFWVNAFGTSSQGTSVGDTQTMETGIWYHIVGTVDILKKEVMMYKNGELIGTSVYSSWNNGWSGTRGFIIGNLASWIGYEDAYRPNAYISSVRVYDRVIESKEVSELFKQFSKNLK